MEERKVEEIGRFPRAKGDPSLFITTTHHRSHLSKQLFFIVVSAQSATVLDPIDFSQSVESNFRIALDNGERTPNKFVVASLAVSA